MAQPIRALLLEDHAPDAELIVRALRNAGFDPEWRRVETRAAFLEALETQPDIVLADFNLPGWNSSQALRLLQARGCDTPFIVTSGTIGEDEAVAMMREGAADYLLKDRLTRLGPAVRQALDRRRLRAQRRALELELRMKEARFRTLIEKSWELLVVFSGDGVVLYASPATANMLGYAEHRIVGRSAAEFVHPEDQPVHVDALTRCADVPGAVLHTTARIRHKDGSYRDVEGVLTNLLHEPSVGGVVVNYRDITDRVRTDRVLTEAREQLQRAVTAGQVGLWDWNLQTGTVYYSEEWKRQVGCADEDVGTSPDEWRSRLHADDRGRVEQAVQAYREGDAGAYEQEYRFRHQNGTYRHILARATLFLDHAHRPVRLAGSHVDITERVQLETQFRQAQKMEVVGRLAGGIAHDFNNIITIINGTAGLVLDGLREQDPLRGEIAEIMRAGGRAAALTRQLLAFSRKQVMVPKVVSLTEVVREMAPMFRRVIGEDVTLRLELDGDPGFVRVDQGQIEQVIMNLAVNARDAMPHGGTLTILTRRVADVAMSAVPGPSQAVPGTLLSVRDTGVGMDAATLGQAFEPFFTTKDTGKGTGLGLATVHGIVKQSGGSIDLRSEVGAGSVFDILLPVVHEPVSEPRPARLTAPLGGQETILLVEDERGIRVLADRVLTLAGYRVLTAGDAEEAERVFAAAGRPVDLLLTDVVLPGKDGRALAGRLAELQPGMRVLYTSGYMPDGVQPDRHLDDFLAKPYDATELLSQVRCVLDR